MITYAVTQDPHDCCGCTACQNICPVHAISMKTDEKGFCYPEVDNSLCVNCRQCEHVCPMEKNYVNVPAEPDIYAVICKNQNVVRRSSSGGFFTVLCRWILKQDGVIYGAVFDDQFMVCHTRGTTAADIRRFRGSKYVESSIAQIYEQIEKDLKEGRYVLLSGTPCQISALKAWMEAKRIPDEKLYTFDVICHGVPSRKVWADYLDIISRAYAGEDNPIIGINMRSKQASWEKQQFRIKLKNKQINHIIQDFSFNKIFLSLNLHRSSCFNCRYTSFKRPGDFSSGDFWNYKQANLTFSPEGGLNEVLINTPKGKELFLQLADEIEYQPISKEICWQPHLEYSAKEPQSRDLFWEEYLKTDDKEAVLRKYMKGSLVTRVIHVVTPLLRKTGLYTKAGRLYRQIFAKKSNTRA